MVALAGLAFVGTFFFNLSFVLVVIGAALIGFCAALVGFSAFFGQAHAAGVYGAPIGSAAEDFDQHDLPDHTRPTTGRLLRTCAFWLALWFVPVGVLVAALGLDNVFSQMAALSLGGPYAVNSYVALHAVEPYGWLTRNQALDGLALAELAPGPVI